MPRRSPSLVLIHVVWATRERRPMLPVALDERLFGILGRKASEVGCPMIAIGCAHDHVHTIIRLASSVSLGELVRRMKGASAYEMNHDAKSRRRIVWQEGYWAESLDPSDFGLLLQYVRQQRDHHDDSHPAERWAASAPTDDLNAAID